MIKPETLIIFIRVCETLSFTKAAEALNIPRSTVSDAIRRLEHDLCAELIKRTTRKVQVTEDGMLFYERAQFLLDEFTKLESTFTNREAGSVHGRVRVDMPTILAKSLIIPRLHEFISSYPEIKVEIGSTDRNIDLVEEGIDLAIRAGRLKDSSLIARKVGEHQIVNCVSANYIERYGVPRTLKQLKDHYQVHYHQHFGVGSDGFEYYDGQKNRLIKTNSLISVNNTVSYHAACLAGLGIIQVPLVGVHDYLESGEMLQVLKKYQMEPMPIHFVHTSREYIPERVKVFMNWCEIILKDYLQ